MKRWLSVAVLFWLLFAALYFLYRDIASGVDYYYTFNRALQGWHHGQEVFTPPYYGFFNAPWVLLILTPMSWLTFAGAEAALMLISLLIMWRGWRTFTQHPHLKRGYTLPFSLAICFLNLYVVDFFLRVQLDGLVLLGVLLMYSAVLRRDPYLLGISWFLATIRPTSVILLFPYTVWRAYQDGYVYRAFIIPLIVFVGSLLIFDYRWLWRWYTMITGEGHPRPGAWLVSPWEFAALLDLPPTLATIFVLMVAIITLRIWLKYPTRLVETFGFLISASLVIIPYAHSYNYSVMTVVTIPPLIKWKPWLLLPLWLLTNLPVLRAVIALNITSIELLFPFTLWILYLIYFTTQRKPLYNRLQIGEE